jgi:hypothetical protein
MARLILLNYVTSWKGSGVSDNTVTPLGRVLEKPGKKYSTFLGTQRRFITTFTTNCHLSLSWVRSIQFSYRSILILSSSQYLSVPTGLFPSGFSMRIIFAVEYSSSLLQFSPLSWYLVPLRLKYLPQHCIFEHPQCIFLPDRDKVSHSYKNV